MLIDWLFQLFGKLIETQISSAPNIVKPSSVPEGPLLTCRLKNLRTQMINQTLQNQSET